jgi:hypothetical protein
MNKKTFYAIIKRNFCKKLTGYDKMNIIIERQRKEKETMGEEFKQVEKKFAPIISFTQVFRSPIYISTFLLIWENPLTLKFTYLLLFSNYYLIALTALEGAVLFSHGLVYYNIVRSNKLENKEVMDLRLKTNRKRLFMLVTFFCGLSLAVYFVNNMEMFYCLGASFLLNFYLYVKGSKHLATKLVNSVTYLPRMKFIYTNMFFCAILGLIIYNKQKFINDNCSY